MLLENVTNELCKITRLDIETRYGSRGKKFCYNFIYNAKRAKDGYNKEIRVVRKFAKMLNVPVSFVVEILKLERVEEIEHTART